MNYLHQSVIIKSTPEKIWNILIDVEKWNQWDSDVKRANLDSQFAVGAQGTLVAIDNSISTFYITGINKFNYYSNYYQLPFFTKLNFIHKIEKKDDFCEVSFTAKFTGLLKWYFLFKQRKTIQSVMKYALTNLAIMCAKV